MSDGKVLKLRHTDIRVGDKFRDAQDRTLIVQDWDDTWVYWDVPVHECHGDNRGEIAWLTHRIGVGSSDPVLWRKCRNLE